MKKFTKDQYKQVAEILGNLSVAWISVGFIAPIITKTEFSRIISGYIAISFVIGGLLAIISVLLVRGKR